MSDTHDISEPSKQTDISRREDQRFNQDMEDLIQYAEDMRLNAMKMQRSRGFTSMTVGLIAIVIGASGFGWFLLVEAEIIRAVGAIVLGIVIAVGLHIWSAQALSDYEKDYKAKFLPKMAKILGGLSYHPTRGISAKILSKTGVIPAHDIYEAEDCFMGKYKGVKVLFSEARLKHKMAHKEPIFDGLFVLLEIPEAKIKGHTILSADKEMVKTWRSTRWKKLEDVSVQVDNASWDRFSIFSDAPDAAASMIDNALLKELSEAADIFDKSPMSAVLFRKKYIFMMIPYEGDMFEPSNIHMPITTKRTAMQCKKEIEKIIEIIDIFDIYNASN